VSYEHVKFLRQNQTTAERLLWVQLRAKRVGNIRFRRQHPLGPYVVDFYCHAARLVIELDGESHDLSVAADTHRTAWLKNYGVDVLRFTNRDVNENLEGVVRTIEARLSRSNPSPNPSQGEGD
jgi:very-short-patch-repair endonuclease